MDLRNRRQQLLDRHDALAPKGGRATKDLCEVAQGLVDIAREAERQGYDPIEVARTFRWAGMAFLDAAPSMDEAITRRALDPLLEADRRTDRTAYPVDGAKTDYCVGRALMNLSAGEDGTIAGQAVERLVKARATARAEAPELLPGIEDALVTAEQVAVLRAEADRSPPEAPTEAADIKRLFGLLQREVDRDLPSMDPVRQESIQDVMAALTGLVDTAGTERTLAEMAVERERLDQLMQRMRVMPQDDDG